MSTLKELLDRISNDQIDVHAAVPEFQTLIRTTDPDRPAGELTFEQREQRAWDDDYGDDMETFTQVTAAWIAGDLTDEQYGVLRDAATQKVGAVDPGPDFNWDFSDIDDPDA